LFTVGSVVRIHPWEPFFSLFRTIAVCAGPSGFAKSLRRIKPHCIVRKPPADPFKDNQDMLRIKTGQQGRHPSTKAAFAAIGVADSNIAVVRHGKQIERLNDMRTKS
jgi:hypothetical protein